MFAIFFGKILVLMIAGKIAKIIELAKILYHTVLSSVKPIPHMVNEMAREHWWKSRNLNDCSDGGIYMETMILRIELKSLLSEFNVLCSCRWGRHNLVKVSVWLRQSLTFFFFKRFYQFNFSGCSDHMKTSSLKHNIRKELCTFSLWVKGADEDADEPS